MAPDPDFDELRAILGRLPDFAQAVPLQPSDALDFMEQCPDCLQWIDIRDIPELLRHDGPGHAASPKKSVPFS